MDQTTGQTRPDGTYQMAPHLGERQPIPAPSGGVFRLPEALAKQLPEAEQAAFRAQQETSADAAQALLASGADAAPPPALSVGQAPPATAPAPGLPAGTMPNPHHATGAPVQAVVGPVEDLASLFSDSVEAKASAPDAPVGYVVKRQASAPASAAQAAVVPGHPDYRQAVPQPQPQPQPTVVQPVVVRPEAVAPPQVVRPSVHPALAGVTIPPVTVVVGLTAPYTVLADILAELEARGVHVAAR